MNNPSELRPNRTAGIRPRLQRATGALAFAGALTMLGGTAAAYTVVVTTPPPAGVPGAPVVKITISTAGGSVHGSITVPGHGPADVALNVPAGAVPPGSQVVLSNTNAGALGAFTGKSTPKAAFVISLVGPDGKKVNAAQPITVTVTSPDLKAGDVVYEVTASGLQKVTTVTDNGVVTFAIQGDPAFAVLPADAVLPSPPSGSSGGTATRAGGTSGTATDATGGTSTSPGHLAFTGFDAAGLTGVGVLAIAAGGALTFRRRRRTS